MSVGLLHLKYKNIWRERHELIKKIENDTNRWIKLSVTLIWKIAITKITILPKINLFSMILGKKKTSKTVHLTKSKKVLEVLRHWMFYFLANQQQISDKQIHPTKQCPPPVRYWTIQRTWSIWIAFHQHLYKRSQQLWKVDYGHSSDNLEEWQKKQIKQELNTNIL